MITDAQHELPPRVKGCTERRRKMEVWSKDAPNESGYWWWWNEDGPPIPVNIDWSPTNGGNFYAQAGQHGWNRHQWVKDMGGYWMQIIEPPVPEA